MIGVDKLEFIGKREMRRRGQKTGPRTIFQRRLNLQRVLEVGCEQRAVNEAEDLLQGDVGRPEPAELGNADLRWVSRPVNVL